MRIKEVEELTGLTAKAIRLYESKGLLNVARDSENDYRHYTQDDVERLKTIAFLREMDISIQDIKAWVDGKLTMQDLMRYTAGQANNAEKDAKLRGELAAEILRLMEADPDLNVMDAMDDVQTLRELKSEIGKLGDEIKGNLMLPVFTTVIALGPIGWTVINILENRTKYALISFGFSLLALFFVFTQWMRYFRVAKEKRTKSGCLPGLVIAVLVFALVIGLLVFVEMCQMDLFAGEEASLTLFRYPWINILLLVPIAEIFLAYYSNQKEAVQENKEEITLTYKQRILQWTLLIVFNLTLLYGSITAVSVCDGQGFVRHSFFNPAGKYYTLDQIERVEVGFYGNGIPILTGHQNGDFYYKITFEDGHTEDWAQSSPTDDDQDPWQALLELDAWLMSAGIDKESSDKHRDKALLDQECLEICDAIINNK